MSYSGAAPLPIISGGTGQTTFPAFFANLQTTQTNVTGDGTTATLICDTKVYDITTSYNVSTGIFSAPVAGNYFFYAAIFVNGLASGHTSMLSLFVPSAGSDAFFTTCNPFAMKNASGYQASGSTSINLAANATMKIQSIVGTAAKAVSFVGASASNLTCYFGGYLLT